MVALAITAGVVAIPQILALRSGNTRSGASLIHWGYTLGAVPVTQVLKYLWWTFSLKWILILIALLFFSWRNLRLFIAMFSLFLLTFCLQFSDEGLANHKFLNIWLVLANLLVGYGLLRLWRLRIKGWAIPFRVVAFALVFPIILGGVIDFFPIHNLPYIETNYTKDRLIDWIRAETKPDAVFASDKFVNHPILLAGRKIFFGYTYFTWGAGYDIAKREVAYKLMFESKNAHQVFTLLKANRIDYVAWDAGVRGVFKNSNEQEVYVPNFKKVFDGPDYWQLAVYKVPENADFVPISTVPPGGSLVTAGISVFAGGKGKENGQFDFPRGVAVDSAGNILVADTNNGRLQKFSPTGQFISVIGKLGQGPGDFQQPGGIALDAAGNIYVADVSNHRVQKLKPDGTFLGQWKGPDVGFYGPRDIAIGPDNSVYVVDEGHGRVVKMDSDGKTLAIWGGAGKEDGQFGDATSVAIDGKNNKVYVADPGNRRIQVFDTYGKFLGKWTVDEWRPVGWSFQDLVVDLQAERLYASSVATDEVLVFDLTGKKIESLRPKPPDKLEGCSSLALVKGKLYALNTYGNRLSWIDLPK
jgi:sugar lactone lactonase YvrE